MYGYGSGEEDVVRIPETPVWEQPERMQNWANEQEAVAIGEVCDTPQELLKSGGFATFLRIFNTISARDAQQREMYGWQPTTGEMMLRDKFTRDRAHDLWHKLQIQGRVNVIRGLDDRLQQWMAQLDEIEVKEKEAQKMRHQIGA